LSGRAISLYVNRGKIDVDTLLKILLVLILVWIGLEIVGEVLGLFAAILGPLQPLLGLLLVALIVLYLLDKL
jgi:hypothetical protein